ncbi:MAG: cyclodeaminase/cyclohydrolase family protein [Deltaproteobacteria bacterium]|nr:cyclodeaminase/cyclohydrolase family protein [Deltaproteobacteria bacterium]
MLKDHTISKFLEQTASAEPLPGGGCTAALNAALAASLTEMVANLTIGRKEFQAVEEEMREIAKTAADLRIKLQNDIDNDARAYQAVLAAFKLPKTTDDDKKRRSDAIQQAYKTAAAVPLGVARDTMKILDLAARAIKNGNPNAVTDGAVAVLAARTAALAAAYNVKINLSAIRDAAFVAELIREIEELEQQVIAKEKEILAQVTI